MQAKKFGSDSVDIGLCKYLLFGKKTNKLCQQKNIYDYGERNRKTTIPYFEKQTEKSETRMVWTCFCGTIIWKK